MAPSACANMVARLQRALEALYDVQTGHDVRNFLRLHSAEVPEVLYCRQAEDDAIELRLQLAPALLARLVAHDPFVALGPHNLDDFCVALEGVSHFVNVARAHARGQPISALELEWQAEVDKFCLALCLMHAQRTNHRDAHRMLFAALFADYALRGPIAHAQRERYAIASRSAARRCQAWLAAGLDADLPKLLRQARKTCRLGRADKLA